MVVCKCCYFIDRLEDGKEADIGEEGNNLILI